MFIDRRKHCEEAAKILEKSSLRDCSLSELESQMEKFSSEEIYRRARHVVTEIERTEQAAKALREGDFAQFGQLMIQSHLSLRYFN